MTKKETTVDGHVKTQTAYLLIFLAFGAGFLAGIFFTIYKTGSTPSSMPSQAIPTEQNQMISKYKDAIERNPQNVSAWIQLGHLYFDGNAYTDAINAYEKALQIEPDNPDVMTDLGVMYRRNGQPQKAVDVFNRVIALNPAHQNARFNKGVVLMHDLQDPQGAIEAWEGLLAINPLALAPNGQSVDQLVQHYKEHVTK